MHAAQRVDGVDSRLASTREATAEPSRVEEKAFVVEYNEHYQPLFDKSCMSTTCNVLASCAI
jgi:hypothetical protein